MKTITMKKTISLFAVLAFGLLTACGDDVTNNEVLKAESYSTKEDLPDCGEKLEGKFATIPSKGEVYVCADGKWKTLLSKASASENGGFACSTEELKNGSGYKVVCGGDSVAVVTNGAKGDTGNKGSKGADGNPGKSGGSGSNGKAGEDRSLGEGDCAVLNAGQDYAVYDCGDSVYVKNMGGLKSWIRTWNALSSDGLFYDPDDNDIGYFIERYLPSSTAGKSEGSLKLWEGESDNYAWESPSTSADVSEKQLAKNFAIKGTAELKVEEGATKSDYWPIEPSVGVEAYFYSVDQDISDWGGVCLTYTATKEMELLIVDDLDNVARAPLKASTKETTESLYFSAFTPDKEGVELKDIIKHVYSIFIKAVGGTTAGKYTNDFAIYKMGAYDKCAGPTVNTIKKPSKGKTGTLKETRDGVEYTYNTVTIGEDVWMAQNLRVPYDENDGIKDMALCPSDPDVLEAKGCLYTWAAAMDSVGLYNDASVYKDKDDNDDPLKHCGYNMTCALEAPVKGICPDGWHLPTKAEYQALYMAAGYDPDFDGETRIFAGRALGKIVGLEEDSDWLGFNATIAGYYSWYSPSWSFNGGDKEAYMWLSDEKGTGDALVANVTYVPSAQTWWLSTESSATKASYAFAVRCVQDKVKK